MKHIHLVGIGGIGMSAIASLLLKKGINISGSDVKESQLIASLKKLGAKIYIGHNKDNLALEIDTLVYSSAIKQDNPELIEAKRRGLNVFKRAEILSYLMQGKKTITVTGAHGKTTTTSLIALMLYEANLHPTVAIGGLIRNFSVNAWMGDGDYFVAEADESDGSFLNYTPDYSIITNIDKEHLDYYGNFKSLLNAFAKFISLLKKGGLLIVSFRDKNLLNLAKRSGKKFKTFGLTDKADIWASNINMRQFGCEFDCFLAKAKMGRISSPLIGEHNITNCLAVILLGLELGIDFEIIKKAISSFQGTKRRQELKFKNPELIVIDDYAHHPTEIQATLKAIKQSMLADNSYRKIITVFQPHRYSRTKLLLPELSRSFGLSDHLIITDIYAASELPLPGIDAEVLYRQIKKNKPNNVYYLEKNDIIPHLLKNLSSGDVVVFLGAGDITKIADEFAQSVKKI
jgi:UDP-N-acetylmuramate--alanine ligase